MMDTQKCLECTHMKVVSGTPWCRWLDMDARTLADTDCQDFKPVELFKFKKTEGDTVMEEMALAMYHSGVVLTTILALKCIEDGFSLEDLKLELQATRETWTEELMKTELGREQLEALNRIVSRMGEEEE